MEFCDKVKSVRIQLKLSQTEMAKQLGVAFSTLNRWEKGHYKPSYDAMQRLEKFCVANKVNI